MSHRPLGLDAAAPPPDPSNAAATAFEELTVAEKELRVQNEALMQMQIASEREHARYRELFQHAPVPYLVTDVFGTIREANRAAGSLLQCRESWLIGKPLLVFTHDPSRRRVRSVISAMQDAEESITVRFSLVTRGKRLLRAKATIAGRRDHRGNLTEIRWLLVDRTRERTVERVRRRETSELNALVAARTSDMERAQRLKDQLVATVSHELRTGLSAVGGYTELLEIGARGPLSAAQLADVARIHRAYDHLARIVDDLLSYNKMSGGQVDIELTDFLIGDVLQGAVELVAPRAAELGVTVLFSDNGPAVRADAERVRQILVNLLSNALKYGGDGPVTIRCGIDERGEHATVEVADRGRGIPESSRASIFEPFVRLRVDLDIPGAGLGLAISRDLARAMGGDLVLAPSDRGAVFQLSLPLSTRLAHGG